MGVNVIKQVSGGRWCCCLCGGDCRTAGSGCTLGRASLLLSFSLDVPGLDTPHLSHKVVLIEAVFTPLLHWVYKLTCVLHLQKAGL